LQLEGASKMAGIPGTARDRLQRALDTARSAAVEAKRAVSDLRASPLAGKPLAQALKGLARGFVSDTGVSVTVRAKADVALAEHVEAELFRIAQEALTNVGKHAGARVVEIGLRRTKGKIQLSITDDGRGFEHDLRTGGHGLRGMTERAALLGGTLVAGRKRGGGTRVVATMPLDGESR
jgi:signal transduction histidine kinase